MPISDINTDITDHFSTIQGTLVPISCVIDSTHWFELQSASAVFAFVFARTFTLTGLFLNRMPRLKQLSPSILHQTLFSTHNFGTLERALVPVCLIVHSTNWG